MEPGVKLAMTARAQSIPPSTITAASTAPSPTPGRTSPPCLRTRGQVRKPRHTPIAKYEQVCYSIPMKWAPGPLLFLGACRIHIALEANHRESPCGRRAEGTTQGARPSEEGWDRSRCRYKAQAAWSYPAPLRFRYGSLRSHYGSFTVPLRFLYGLLRSITPWLRLRAYTHQNPAD